MIKTTSRSVSICVYLWLILFLVFTHQAGAQVRPVNDYGALGLGRLLKRLNTTASVMMIGAHPDDEDSALLAYLARGENARTAYLSLTRGDGGQNIIGPELFESLGVIRTEELLQARRLDGAEQYFTRAFDYGFSKTLDEAKQKWDEKVVLCDVVGAIRGFQPQVVISRFSGTPADGHGQHQYAGYISPIAVKAAADPKQCTTSGAAWQVLKFYVGQGFGPNSTATLRLNTGTFDPLLGRTYFEIAMEGRSLHRSQGEGRIEFHGDQFSGLNLIESTVPKVENERSVFDSIDTSLKGFPKGNRPDDPDTRSRYTKIQTLLERAANEYRPPDQESVLKILVQACKEMDEAAQWKVVDPGRTGPTRTTTEVSPPYWHMIGEKQHECSEAVKLAAGVQIDALVDKETVVPGEDFLAAVKVFFPKGKIINVKNISISSPPLSGRVTEIEEPKENNPGFARREVANKAAYFRINVAANKNVTQPYWLESPRDGDLYRWPRGGVDHLPFQHQSVGARVKLEIEGTEITLFEPVQFRYADPARGEIRRHLDVVPGLSMGVDHDLLIVPFSDKAQKRRLVMSVTKLSEKPLEPSWASLNLGLTGDWVAVPTQKVLELKNKGDKASIPFDFTVPAGTKPGVYNIFPHVAFREAVASSEMHTIAYPHIQTHRFYTRVQTVVRVLDLKVAPVKVGYIMGSGDEVPAAIRQMGLDVTMLEEKDLASGELAGYDSIVVGIRASETRPDFVSNNQRLLDYVKNGGNLIVQYQRPSFAQQNLLPFPATMGPRVVDENAAVTILQPEHPVFNYPNKINQSDFTGWVQERNLYNFNTFDAGYVPLLESHDVGEPENKGGLMVAGLGKGTYVYCSYSFFRQLPAGVGGAYRLLANLLSQPKVKK